MSEEVWTNETEIIRRDEAGNVRRFVRVGLLEQAQQDNAHLRSLLQALVAAGPEAFSYDADAEEGEWAECFYCGVMLPVTEHEADCPWLLAKQYLEAHNE